MNNDTQLEEARRIMVEHREALDKLAASEAAEKPDKPAPASPSTVTEVVSGFEIVKWDGYARTWETVAKFRNAELALRQAASELRWYQERHPKELYQLHALVSHAPPAELPATETKEANGQLDSTH